LRAFERLSDRAEQCSGKAAESERSDATSRVESEL
jgi:hypothetical protein